MPHTQQRQRSNDPQLQAQHNQSRYEDRKPRQQRKLFENLKDLPGLEIQRYQKAAQEQKDRLKAHDDVWENPESYEEQRRKAAERKLWEKERRDRELEDGDFMEENYGILQEKRTREEAQRGSRSR